VDNTDLNPRERPADRALPEGDDALRTQPVQHTVLVVEDDPSCRELVVEMLSLWGYRPVAVGSAEEADYVMRHEQLDAALIDVFLPGKSGASLLGRLRVRFPQALLIATSALGDPAMARRFKGLGADLFLPKPLEPEALGTALKGSHRTWH
jgi:DNA-binding response OmpR family regulator